MAIGLAGVVLPLVPTVPLMILAAFCFSKSSRRLHDWLVTHPTYGVHIRDWRESGAIRRPAKRLATLAILMSFGISLLLNVEGGVLLIQAVVLGLVMLFIWTRPDS